MSQSLSCPDKPDILVVDDTPANLQLLASIRSSSSLKKSSGKYGMR